MELLKEVHRQNFHSIRQKEGRLITHFLARLWTLAKFCEFTTTCPNEPDCGWQIDNSSEMVDGQIVAKTCQHGTPKQNISRNCNPHDAATEV